MSLKSVVSSVTISRYASPGRVPSTDAPAGRLAINPMSQTSTDGSTNSRESAPLGRTAAVLVYTVILAGGGILAHSVWDLFTNPVDGQWLILAALTVSTAWLTLRIPTTELSFSISDTFNIAAAVLFGPSVGAITAALDALVLSSQFAVTRRSAYRISFNVAVSAMSLWLAAQRLFCSRGGPDRP